MLPAHLVARARLAQSRASTADIARRSHHASQKAASRMCMSATQVVGVAYMDIGTVVLVMNGILASAQSKSSEEQKLNEGKACKRAGGDTGKVGRVLVVLH
jgi:hypothetical protein